MTQREEDLSEILADLREQEVLARVRLRLEQGDDPLRIVDECRSGMRKVGERYEKKIYYISGLIMAGQIMHQVGELVLSALEERIDGRESGRILLGTVEGDIHYIGKDIMKVLLRCHGFTVFDLGVDVSPGEFLAGSREFKPHIVGLSCLLNPCYEAMGATIALLRAEAGRISPVPAMIMGGLVDENVCRHLNADFWATDAMTGIRLCQQAMHSHGE